MILRAVGSILTPAYGAATGLVAIQVGIGLLYKAAQHGGSYQFSASSSITISETLKFILSTCLFYRECRRRHATASPEYCVIPAPPRDSLDEKNDDGDESPCLSERTNSHDQSTSRTSSASFRGITTDGKMTLDEFLKYCRGEVPSATRYGFAQLALLYALINNTVFVLYRLADPGTIQLIKSGGTLVTALVIWFCLGTRVVKMQWVAIFLQISGLVVTQYHPENGASYPYSTYLALFFQTFLSAASGVYNQSLCKRDGASLHADNMYLYSEGALVNLLIHLIVRLINPEEPGFFTGYSDLGAVMVIVSNVFIGIAMTAVYKYADAVIKCFATAISTALLLYLSPILFGADFTFLIAPGTCVVFLATWMYMEFSPPKTSEPSATQPVVAYYFAKWSEPFQNFSPKGKLRGYGLMIWTTITILIISALTIWDTRSGPTHGSAELTYLIESPFKNTIAFVRWNSDGHPERMEQVKAYEPFFHTLHFSMPNYTPDEGPNFVNLTHDSWEVTDLIHKGVAEFMKVVLEDDDNGIEGMLYFHFDLWVDPMGFQDMDYKRIWYPDSPNPKYICMHDTSRYPEWHGWWGMQDMAMDAQKSIANESRGYVVDTTEWCVGWSDIYHIPRAYFADYVYLTNFFYDDIELFHEVSIPTILHIIDKTRRVHPDRPLIDLIGDCWGHCCQEGAQPEDVVWKRCGHRLDYTDEELVNTHYDRLAYQTDLLGTEAVVKQMPKVDYHRYDEEDEGEDVETA